MSKYVHLSTPDPEWAQLATMLPPAPATPPTLEEQRQMIKQLAQGQHKFWDPPCPTSGLKVADTTIPVEAGTISVRTYVPEPKAGETRYPVLVWFHGGGFMFGDLDMDDALLRLICVNQRVSCVNVDYRLAPEHPFPNAVNDSYLATKWECAAGNVDLLSADLTKGFMVGGTSSGGNLAAVLSLKARDDPSFKAKITGQILQIPYLCPSPAYPEKWKDELLSADKMNASIMMNEQSVQLILKSYAPPDPADPDVAPLLASSHANLPAAYFQICGLDYLRDEAFLYEKVLRESGVPTKHDIYPGQPHGFYGIGPHMAQSTKWWADVQKGVEWILQQK